MGDKAFFHFFYEWLTPMKGCSPEVRCEVYDAIVHFAATGEEMEFKSDVARVAFKFIRQSYERMEHISEVRRQAGSVGGKKSQTFARAKLKQSSSNAQAMLKQCSSSAQAHIPYTIYPIKKDVAIATYKESAANAALSSADADDAGSKQPTNTIVQKEVYISAWNEECAKHSAVLPRIQTLAGRRLDMLRARINEHGRERVLEAFQKAAASEFLNGKGNRGFIANIDWVLRPNNFTKVLEGNYDGQYNAPGTGYNVGTTQIDNSVDKWNGEEDKWG